MTLKGVEQERGFTLLELLVAMLVAASALWIALPSVAAYSDRRRVELAAYSLASTLGVARSRAIERGTSETVVLDAVAGKYAIAGENWHQIEGGISVTTRPEFHSISFRSDGSTANADIGLRAGRHAATIAIDWLSGAASVEFSR